MIGNGINSEHLGASLQYLALAYQMMNKEQELALQLTKK